MVNPSGGQLACEYGSSHPEQSLNVERLCTGCDGELERWTAGV